jgi:hypothetical protein
MEPSSPTPPDSDAPAHGATKGLPAPVWVLGVIVILGLFMWIFRS